MIRSHVYCLVPRPSLAPVFLQYAKIEREGLGYLILYDDIRWTEGRPTGGSVQLL